MSLPPKYDLTKEQNKKKIPIESPVNQQEKILLPSKQLEHSESTEAVLSRLNSKRTNKKKKSHSHIYAREYKYNQESDEEYKYDCEFPQYYNQNISKPIFIERDDELNIYDSSESPILYTESAPSTPTKSRRHSVSYIHPIKGIEDIQNYSSDDENPNLNAYNRIEDMESLVEHPNDQMRLSSKISELLFDSVGGTMVLVMIPWIPNAEIFDNYVNLAIKDSLCRGEHPICPYALYSNIMNFDKPTNRHYAQKMCSSWLMSVGGMVVYNDYNVNDVVDIINNAKHLGIVIQYRRIPRQKNTSA